MKRLFFALLLGCLWTGLVQGQQRGTGIGFIAGEPIGFSAKHWLADQAAIDAALGWSFDGPSSFHFHSDWLWHDFAILPVERGALPLYYGLGARFKAGRGGADSPGRGDSSRSRLGLRVPFGVAYCLEDSPVELFVEIVPILDVVPGTKLNLNAAVGARWYFR